MGISKDQDNIESRVSCGEFIGSFVDINYKVPPITTWITQYTNDDIKKELTRLISVVDSVGLNAILHHKRYCTNKQCMYHEDKNYVSALQYLTKDNFEKFPFEFCEIIKRY